MQVEAIAELDAIAADAQSMMTSAEAA